MRPWKAPSWTESLSAPCIRKKAYRSLEDFISSLSFVASSFPSSPSFSSPAMVISGFPSTNSWTRLTTSARDKHPLLTTGSFHQNNKMSMARISSQHERTLVDNNVPRLLLSLAPGTINSSSCLRCASFRLPSTLLCVTTHHNTQTPSQSLQQSAYKGYTHYSISHLCAI